ncbi:Complement component 1 Q subcomponent-binding protein, mitochondrial [Plecturocebus cupreus]
MSGGLELELNRAEAKLAQKYAGKRSLSLSALTRASYPTLDSEEKPSKEQKVEEQELKLTSTTSFVVKVIKSDGKKALVLDCPEDEGGSEAEVESHIFSVRKVSFSPKGCVNERTHVIHSTQIPWTRLYVTPNDFLVNRDVTNSCG